MPVRTKSEMDEKGEQDAKVSISPGSEPVVETEFAGEVPVTRAVGLHDEILTNPEEYGLVKKSSVREMEERLEVLEGVVAEMSEVMEIVSGASDPDRFEMVMELWKDREEVSRFEWESDVHELQEKRYE